jgi:hypothetical protein
LLYTARPFYHAGFYALQLSSTTPSGYGIILEKPDSGNDLGCTD